MGLVDGAEAAPGSSCPVGCLKAWNSSSQSCARLPSQHKEHSSKGPDSSPGSAGQLVFPLPLWLSGETGVRVLFSSLAWVLPHGGLIPSSCAI